MSSKSDNLYPPASVYPLGVRCPVPYCDSEPYRKCCDRLGYTLAGVHIQRLGRARRKQKAELQAKNTQ
jgi:hypothetical protein